MGLSLRPSLWQRSCLNQCREALVVGKVWRADKKCEGTQARDHWAGCESAGPLKDTSVVCVLGTLEVYTLGHRSLGESMGAAPCWYRAW